MRSERTRSESLKNIEIMVWMPHRKPAHGSCPFVDALKRLRALIERFAGKGYRSAVSRPGRRPWDRSMTGGASPAPRIRGAMLTELTTFAHLVFEPAGDFRNADTVRRCPILRIPQQRTSFGRCGHERLVRPSLTDRITTFSLSRVAEGDADLDVVGPICESAISWPRPRRLPLPSAGEYRAVKSAGAYLFSMSSIYNSRPRAAEVRVRGGHYFVVRKRENGRTWFRLERSRFLAADPFRTGLRLDPKPPDHTLWIGNTHR